MARVRFFGPAPLQTTAKMIYTCPPLTTTTLFELIVSNPTNATQTFTLSIGTDSAGDRVYSSVPVAAKSQFSKKCMYVLAPGDLIQASASSSSVVMVLSGNEDRMGPYSYSTTFPGTENPISEGGNWTTDSGLGQANMLTSGGLAFGTDIGGGPTGDSAAILTGFWPPDMTLTTTLHKSSPVSFQECELLFRASIGASALQGYEYFLEEGGQYLSLVKRLGSNGGVEGVDYIYLVEIFPLGSVPANGDVLSGTLQDNTFTAKYNGATIWVHDIRLDKNGATVSTFTSGSVGIGSDGPTGGGAYTPSNWCFADFSAVPAS